MSDLEAAAASDYSVSHWQNWNLFLEGCQRARESAGDPEEELVQPGSRAVGEARKRAGLVGGSSANISEIHHSYFKRKAATQSFHCPGSAANGLVVLHRTPNPWSDFNILVSLK